MASRPYSSPLRDEATARTRERIVAAAGRLFAAQGYVATTMAAIAREAGVSVQSVHLAGPKSTLLMASFEVALAGDEGTHPLHERPALAAIMTLPPDEALPAYVHFLAEANARTAGISRALYVAAETDETIAALVADLDERRHHDIRAGILWCIDRGMLQGDIDVDQRTDVLTHLVSPETYRFFVRERGWSDDLYREWLLGAIERLVLQP